MISGAHYSHTNLIARDWRSLAAFYEAVFGCVRTYPERDYAPAQVEGGTGVIGSGFAGAHLLLPGYGSEGPTLEIYTYDPAIEGALPQVNAPGFAHVAFGVDDVDSAQREVLDSGGSAVADVISSTRSDGAVIKWCYVRDPEGNIIELQSWSYPQQ